MVLAGLRNHLTSISSSFIVPCPSQADVDLLRRELPTLRPECLRLMEVATTLLQKCAAAGLTLADIGGLMSRPLDALDGGDIDNPSELERACVVARQVCTHGISPAWWDGKSYVGFNWVVGKDWDVGGE